jgi:RNA polymerase primary sigma factor
MLDSLVDGRANSADEEVSHKQSLEIEVKRCLGLLNEREKNIVRSFFGIGIPEPLTLNEIALKYEMSGERVRQLKDKAIKQLRNSKRSSLLRDFLGT